jgi:parvulin-like peptidyl-prolyl isomerase
MIKIYLFILLFCLYNLEASAKEDILEKLSEMEYMKPFEQLDKSQKDKIVSKYKKRERIYKLSKKEGVLDSKEFKKEIQSISKEVAMNMFLQNKHSHIKVNKNEIKDYYHSNLHDYTQIHAYTIVRDNKKDLIYYIKRLLATPKEKQFDLFTSLAKQKSLHPRASRGGDLGYISYGTMARPFGEKSFGLDEGNFSIEPFKTTLGWHIVYVKKKEIKSLESVEKNIEAILRDRKYKEWFKNL